MWHSSLDLIAPLISFAPLIALLWLPGSAFLVLILRLKSPFCFGFFSAAWAYFASSLLLIFPPSGVGMAYLLPSAWTAVGLYYRPDQYWPEASLYEEVRFALGDSAGKRLLAEAHCFWTLLFGLAGGVAAVRWQKENPLYVARRDPLAPQRPADLTWADVLLFAASCAVVAYLASGTRVEMSLLAPLGFSVLVLFAGTRCAWLFVALCGLGFACLLILQGP